MSARDRAEQAAGAAADAAIAAVASPAVAKAARPITRRLVPVVVSALIALAVTAAMLFSAGAGGVGLLTLLIADAATTQQTSGTQVCLPGGVAGDLSGVESLSSDEATRNRQLSHAALLTSTGEALGAPAKGWVVAVAVGIVESRLLNLPSAKYPASLDYPHDTYEDGSIPSGDHTSVGLMQQQEWWWARDMSKGMDPAFQARQFYGGADFDPSIPGLFDIPGWEDMPIGQAAQAVQRSAFPSRYADVEADAAAIVAAVTGIDPGTCTATTPGGGGWQWPLNPLPAVSSPYGMRLHPVLGYWKLHDGVDWAPACNTPIAAAGAGTARVEHPAWAGNLVIIDHGGGVETWYGHMETTSVTPGATVNAGQRIGTVGTRGYSTGCHLHFMVVINGEPVDPVPWLTRQINTTPDPAGEPPPSSPPPSSPPTSGGFTVLTYNVHYGRAPAATREVEQLAARHTPDVICLQEAGGVRQAPAGYRMWRPQVPTHGGRGPTATPLLISTRHTVTDRGFAPLTGREYVGPAGAGPDYATPRQIVWATLGNGATVGCTHFTASKDASQARTRLWNQQAAGAVRFLTPPGRILGGDFNATPDSRWMAGFRRVAVVDSNRARTHVSGGRIDMVWGSGYLPGPARVLPKMGSDHFPVVTTWRAQ